MSIADLTDILEEAKEISNEIEKIKHLNINNYIIELIRISERYKFHAKLRKIKRTAKKPTIREPENNLKSIEAQIKEEEKQDIENKQYLNLKELNNEQIKVYYGPKEVKVDYSVYRQKNSKLRPLELWELTGFYQERTTQQKVRVQLWPEHLPYDHFKRKRAFLFC